MRLVFFYGLFMDESLLAERRLHPEVVGAAAVSNYELRIGERASLVPREGAMSHGRIIALAEDELDQLYSEASVSEYVPETVAVQVEGMEGSREATCYNLPRGKLGRQCDPEYVRRLSALAIRYGFPSHYIEHIERFGRRD